MCVTLNNLKSIGPLTSHGSGFLLTIKINLTVSLTRVFLLVSPFVLVRKVSSRMEELRVNPNEKEGKHNQMGNTKTTRRVNSTVRMINVIPM